MVFALNKAAEGRKNPDDKTAKEDSVIISSMMVYGVEAIEDDGKADFDGRKGILRCRGCRLRL
jgi:hypothetical protein